MENQQWRVDKLRKLVEMKEAEGLEVIEWQFTSHHDVHVIFYRDVDESHIVWTAYHNGREETTYSSFYNGAYDLDLLSARKELDRRMQRQAAMS